MRVNKTKSLLKTSTLLWGMVLVLLFGATTILPSFIRLVALLFWLGAASWMTGSLFSKRIQSHRMLFGSITLLSVFGLVLTFVALLSSLTVFSVLLVLVILSVLVTIVSDQIQPRFSRFKDGLAHTPSFPYLLIALFGDTWVFVSLYGAWTAEPLVSPWQLSSFSLFIVYAVTTFVVVVFASLRRDNASLLLSIFHFFVSLSVAVIVYAVGFGFDPFIHRAAEVALVQDGAIEPRRLLYLGQYSLVSGANLLTGMRVIFLDKWLVPVLASLAIPLVAFLGLRDGWKLSDRRARAFLHLALFFPAMYFVFTVPFNLTLLFLLVVSFVLPLADTWRTKGSIMLLSLFALCVHPLGGVPILLLLGLSLIQMIPNKKLRRGGFFLGSLGSMIAIPFLFSLNQVLLGQPPFFIQSHLLSRFLSLFTDPYLPGSLPIPFLLEWFYDAMRWLPRILAVLALVFAWRHRATQKVSVVPALLLSLSLIVSLFLLSGFFRFADVIAYEQMEFASRLLQTILLLTTPWVIVFVASLWKKHVLSTFVSNSFLAFIMALFLTATWYLSYPQLNLKVRDVGASVSAADVEVARFLESRYVGEPYLVLSHQMTSAAAIQESGFRHYLDTDDGLALWYAIPTGGTLYKYFLRMSTEGPSSELLEEIRDYANVDHVYFVSYDSWPNAGFVRAKAASFADASYGIQGTKLVIYEYK